MHAEATVERQALPARAPSVRQLEVHEAEKWDAFVAQCRDATFFHRIGWREIIEDVFGHRCYYLVAEREGSWSGVLPLAVVRSRLFGHALVSLPFAVYGGPAANDSESAHALVVAAGELARTLNVDHLEIRNTRTQCPDWPRQDLYVTFRRQIFGDVDANMLAIPRKQRAMVRKGIKNGLAVEIDSSVDRFFALYADNVHRHGTPPFPRRYFARLQQVFGEACEIQTIVDSHGRPISGVLSFYFRDEVLPYYAGDIDSARDLAANDFKYWALMRRACERGIRVFDYGRSKRGTGSFDFKKNWGFEPTPLSYEYQLFKSDRVPEHNPLNPKYAAFIALWRRLPRPLVNALGPAIIRNLG